MCDMKKSRLALEQHMNQTKKLDPKNFFNWKYKYQRPRRLPPEILKDDKEVMVRFGPIMDRNYG